MRRYSLMTLALSSHLTSITRCLIKERNHLLPRLIKLCQSDDKIAIEFSIQILASLSKYTQIKDDLAEGLETVASLCENTDPDIKKHTLSVIINLANDFTLIGEVAQFSDLIVPFCIKNLQSQFVQIQQLSMEALYLLCYDKSGFDVFVETHGTNHILTYLLNPGIVLDLNLF